MYTKAVGTTTTGFEGKFRYQMDLQGLGSATGRHPSADLLNVFNDAYKSLRELVTGKGYTQFIVRGTTTTLPVVPVEAGETYAIINVGTTGTPGTPPTFSQIRRIDIKANGSDWFELPYVTFGQLRELTPDRFTTSPTKPRGWCWLNAGTIAGANFTAGQIALAPVPTNGQFCIWTLPDWIDCAGTTDVFYYHIADWEMWHLYKAASMVLVPRDKDSMRVAQWLASQLNEEVPGTPAYNIHRARPVAAGPKTWVRTADYRGPAWR